MKRFRRILPFFILILILAACLGTQAPAPIARYTVGQGAGSTGIHTVLKGETLWTISKHYNIAARDIAVANHVDAPFHLSPGSRLKLPPPQQYRARPGDSLNTVSRLFGVSRSEIARMNHLSPPYKLTGQLLRLPSVTQKSEPQVFAQAVPVDTSVGAVVPGEVMAEALAPPPPRESSAPHESVPPHPTLSPEGRGDQMVVAEAKVIPEKAMPKSPVTAKIPKRSAGKFLRPVKGDVLSSYGPKSSGLFNDGINIAAPRDVPVRAAENGVVVYAGSELKGSGNLVLIRHDGRWMTAYAHLGNIQIKRGDVVKRGQAIGTVGSSGAVDKPQLHFEVRRGTEALNPEVYLEG